ncbi:hypothetical protein CEXT_631501 [Caerostris extrusa]|uniref:Uncharacterized protein n=1 Tax=Caerostris extrusa TaxID=172846 RepID=A0AAV4RVE4_CAEEX|nr:hypothetical protein CEXT_631501 [Caerostris extrusa]
MQNMAVALWPPCTRYDGFEITPKPPVPVCRRQVLGRESVSAPVTSYRTSMSSLHIKHNIHVCVPTCLLPRPQGKEKRLSGLEGRERPHIVTHTPLSVESPILNKIFLHMLF